MYFKNHIDAGVHTSLVEMAEDILYTIGNTPIIRIQVIGGSPVTAFSASAGRYMTTAMRPI